MLDKDNITVLNYNPSVQFLQLQNEDVVIGASEDCIIPTEVVLTMKDLKYIYGQTQSKSAITDGWIMFKEDEQDEIYNELHFKNWKDILTTKEIINIILNPTYDGLKKLLDIRDVTLFDRVRGVFLKVMENEENRFSVSSEVKEIIKTRYKELLDRQVKTRIHLSDTKMKRIEKPVIDKKEIDELKDQNKNLQEKLLEMQQMMKQFMEQQATNSKADNQVSVKESEVIPKKKIGRPKKTASTD